MARITNTYSRYEAIGIRENLSDVIYNIDPTDTPVLTMAKREKVDNTFYEWQQDALTAAGANAQIDGDDIGSTFPAVVPTVRIGNYTQISRKEIIISGTLEATNRAGRKSELAYQAAMRGKEIKRDMEYTLLNNVAGTAGSSSAARKTGSLLTFIKSNTSKGVGGADPTTPATTARTDGTTRALTRAFLDTVISSMWSNGATVKSAVMGATQKVAFSALTGIATNRKDVPGKEQAVIVGAADVYVSDFGNLQVVPDRFARSRDILLLDPDYVSIVTLRPFQTSELAKTGDAEKRMMLTEWGLKVGQEKGLGLVTDLS